MMKCHVDGADRKPAVRVLWQLVNLLNSRMAGWLYLGII